MRGREVLEHAQTLAEVRLDRRLDDLAGRFGHEAADATELPHLVDRAPGARRDHAVDRVDVPGLLVEVLRQELHELRADRLAGLRPEVDDLEVALAVGDDTLLERSLDPVDLLLRLLEHARLRVRDADVVLAERDAGARR